MRLGRYDKLTLGPLTGVWFRALRLKFWPSRLSTDHTRASPSRFVPASAVDPGPRTLYLGENHQVAIYEVGAILGAPDSPVAHPVGSWVILKLDVRLDHVADLCDSRQRKIIGTNEQELTGMWVGQTPHAPTQALGPALFALTDLEAMIVPSSKPGGGRNLVVFPDKLGPRSRITFENEMTGKAERLL